MTTATVPSSLTSTAESIGTSLAARAAANDAADTFDFEAFAEFKRLGLMTAGVPEELGGGGATFVELADMLRTLARYDSSAALALSMHTHQVVIPAYRYRHQGAPTDKLLRRVVDEGLVLISSGGSDWLDSSGEATKVDGGYRINARKAFASGVQAGNLLMTSAVYDDPAAGKAVLHFPVPLSSEQVRIVESWRALGMRATGSHDVVIENLFVPDAAIGGTRTAGAWSGLYHLVAMLALPLIYSVYVGVAESALETALRLCQRKRDDRDVQGLLGEAETNLRTAQIALASAIDLATTAQPGNDTTNEALIRRTIIGESAIRAVEKATEAAGGAGFYRTNGLEKLFRDIQGARHHPLRAPEQYRLTGRLALGLPIDA